MIKSVFSGKFISPVLIITILGHLSFIHNLTGSLVLCLGSDGHAAIESVNDAESCDLHPNLQMERDKRLPSLMNSECQDFSLQQPCFEENQFIIDKKILSVPTLLFSVYTILHVDVHEFIHRNSDFDNIGSIPLKNYSTVCLLH